MMLEATVIPLSSLPTAHPSPEAVRTLTAVVRPPASGRSTRSTARFMATAGARRPRR
jgi:hypothetical protein